MGRTLPYQCIHDKVLDWGDFGPDQEDPSVGTENCVECEGVAVSPNKLYIVVEQGTEYNDQTYDVGGSAKVVEKAYSNRDEAERVKGELLRKTLSDFRLCDFDERYGHFYSTGKVIVDEFMSYMGVAPTESKYGKFYNSGDLWDITWSEFIEWCDEKGYGWEAYAPPLYEVHEVAVKYE